jgi:hypothetical protein
MLKCDVPITPPQSHPEREKHFCAARVGDVTEIDHVASLPNHSQSRSRLWQSVGTPPPCCLFLLRGLLQFFDVELCHLEHGLHDAIRFFVVFVVQQFAQNRRNDLPRHTKPVLEPAAAALLSSGGKFLPKVVNFLLRLATYEKRNGLSEFELRPAIQRDEFHAIESERCRHGTDAFNLRFLEDGGVKPRCLFGLAIEPKERGDFLHGDSPLSILVSYL